MWASGIARGWRNAASKKDRSRLLETDSALISPDFLKVRFGWGFRASKFDHRPALTELATWACGIARGWRKAASNIDRKPLLETDSALISPDFARFSQGAVWLAGFRASKMYHSPAATELATWACGMHRGCRRAASEIDPKPLHHQLDGLGPSVCMSRTLYVIVFLMDWGGPFSVVKKSCFHCRPLRVLLCRNAHKNGSLLCLGLICGYSMFITFESLGWQNI
jgi:hypothetical protein